MPTPRAPQPTQGYTHEAPSKMLGSREGCQTQVAPLGPKGNALPRPCAEDAALGPLRPDASCTLSARAQPRPPIMGRKLGVLRDSGATLRARLSLSHDLGARKLWKETDPNFLPLELKQNLKARGYPRGQRWRLGGGGGQNCVPAWFPGPGSVSSLVVELVPQLVS